MNKENQTTNEKEKIRALIPLVREDINFKEGYKKLSLVHKSYYDMIKQAGLLNELYQRETAQDIINNTELSKEDKAEINLERTIKGNCKRSFKCQDCEDGFNLMKGYSCFHCGNNKVKRQVKK